jgi:hypothetical protein
VPFHKFRNIKFGLLQDLDLADVAVLDGEDAGCLASDSVTNGCRDELLDQGLQVTLGSKFRHKCRHLGSDGPNLCRFGVTGRLDLVVLRAGEGDAEQSDNVSVRGTAVHIAFNDRLLLSDERAELVSCHVHSVEVHKAVVALDVLDTKLDLAVGQGFILVQICQRHLKHTSLQVVRSNFGSLRLGDQGLSAVLDSEDRRSDKLVPLFLQEGVDRLFAATLFGFRKSLVLALLEENERKEESV